jgi:phage terminase small subunit
MAGVKGRSGGARKGAGRKPDLITTTAAPDPLAFLTRTMNDDAVPIAQRIRAAAAAAQYLHIRAGDGGKKDAQAEKAKEAAAGFQQSATPIRLVSAR